MASKYQTLYQKITSDFDFKKFSSIAQLVFYTLKFCKENNAANIFEFFIETLPKRNNLSLKDNEKGIKELVNSGWIVVEGDIVWIVNGLRHNPSFKTNNDKHRKALSTCLGDMPQCGILKAFIGYYELTGDGFDTLCDSLSDDTKIPYPMHITVSVSEDITVTEKVDITTKKGLAKKAITWPKDFKLTPELKQYALDQNVRDGPEKVFEAFRLKAHANGYTYVDWVAAWQGWCRHDYTPKKDGVKPEQKTQAQKNIDSANEWLAEKLAQEKKDA